MVVTMILVLGSTSLAAVECAWVLWTRVDTSGDSESRTQWQLDNAYQNYFQCNIAQKDAVRRAHSFWGEDTGVERLSVDEETGEKQVVIEFEFKFRPGQKVRTVRTVYYRCLPNTIDPREKE